MNSKAINRVLTHRVIINKRVAIRNGFILLAAVVLSWVGVLYCGCCLKHLLGG